MKSNHDEWVSKFKTFESRWSDKYTLTQICQALDVSPIAITRAVKGGREFLGTTKLRLAMADGLDLDAKLILGCLSERASEPWVEIVLGDNEKAVTVDMTPQGVEENFRELKASVVKGAADKRGAKTMLNHLIGVSYGYERGMGMPAKQAAKWMSIIGVKPSAESILKWQGEIDEKAYLRAIDWGRKYQAGPEEFMEQMLTGDSPRAIVVTTFRPGQRIIDALNASSTNNLSLNKRMLASLDLLVDLDNTCPEKIVFERSKDARDGQKITIRMHDSVYQRVLTMAKREGVELHTVFFSAITLYMEREMGIKAPV